VAHSLSRSPWPSSGCGSSTRRCAPPPTFEAAPGSPEGHEPLPVNLLAFLGPLSGPNLGHLLRERLFGLAHNLDAHTQDLLGPPPAPPLVAGIYLQARKAPRALARRLQQQPNAIFVWDFGAVYLGFEHQTFRVEEQMALRMPSTFLAGSKPRSWPPPPVVLSDWESTIAALGFGFLPRRHRSRSRSSRRSDDPMSHRYATA
jgi:hypothetical protein